MAGVGRSRHPLIAALAAAIAFAGITWAGWIDSTEGVAPIKRMVWVSAALAATTACLRIAGLRRRRRASSDPEPEAR